VTAPPIEHGELPDLPPSAAAVASVQDGRAQSTTEPVPDVPPPTPPSTETAPRIEPREAPDLPTSATSVRASSKPKSEQLKKSKGGKRRGIQ